MAITILDNLPDHLKNFLIRRGIKPPVDPNAVPVSSGLVPTLPRRRVASENAYTSGDIDVDPPADIPFDPSYFSNLLGGLFGGSENTYPIPSDFEDKTTWRQNELNVGELTEKEYQDLHNMIDRRSINSPFRAPNRAAFASRNEPVNFAPYLANLGRDTDPNSATKDFIAKTQNDLTFEKDRSGKTPVDRFFGGFDYLDNEYLSDTQKNIATVGKIVPSIMGGLAPVLGLFGAIGQAMGGHHPLNFNKDSNVFMDPVSGTSIWDSLSDGGGGAQVGVLNLDNQIASAANNPESQGQYVKTPYGYITIGNLNNAIKSGLFDSNAIDVGLNTGSGSIQNAGFTDSTPVSFQSFDGGTTTGNAINQYEQLGIGPIWNQAGAIADALNLGYNQIGPIAEDIKNTTVDNQSIYGGIGDTSGLANILASEDEDMINADFTDGALDVDLGSYFGEGDYGDGLI